jgi:hypothetical protein
MILAQHHRFVISRSKRTALIAQQAIIFCRNKGARNACKKLPLGAREFAILLHRAGVCNIVAAYFPDRSALLIAEKLAIYLPEPVMSGFIIGTL